MSKLKNLIPFKSSFSLLANISSSQAVLYSFLDGFSPKALTKWMPSSNLMEPSVANLLNFLVIPNEHELQIVFIKCV